MNFASDNVYGVHPRILEALAAVNPGPAAPYGGDDLTRQAEEKLSEEFATEVRAFLVTTGTAANGLALSAVTPGYGAILCHAEAHISSDECNAAEFFTGGAKIMGLDSPGGKLTPAVIGAWLNGFYRGEHDPKAKGVSLTNVTELGTAYQPAEVRAISNIIRPRGLKLHMDGARFANAVAGLGCSPAELTWKAGVDVLSFGASKNGAMMLEAVVFFDKTLAEDFAYRRMRGGQLVSKSRYLGAQMLAYLNDGLWLESARHANAMAARLVAGLGRNPAIRLPFGTQSNVIFAIMPMRLREALREAGAIFHQRPARELAGSLTRDETVVRLVTSWTTAAEEVDRLVELAACK